MILVTTKAIWIVTKSVADFQGGHSSMRSGMSLSDETCCIQKQYAGRMEEKELRNKLAAFPTFLFKLGGGGALGRWGGGHMHQSCRRRGGQRTAVGSQLSSHRGFQGFEVRLSSLHAWQALFPPEPSCWPPSPFYLSCMGAMFIEWVGSRQTWTWILPQPLCSLSFLP